MFFVLKMIVSAFVIAIVTEISRRLPTYGGIIAALPLVSLLSLFWLSIQGESETNMNQFTLGVLIGLPATGFLLLIVYFLTKHSVPFIVSLCAGMAAWAVFIYIQDLLKRMFT
ncbi:DUF3147 family protein [Halalkalibacterium halodurans]|uniref:DUF3147 family protein n=1 Tax=Halalkalibacterium halodurans TaxID=86665 RepID=UPI002AA9C825|nr:DUF3147 family protein [Halalkalibacterium halodurans]MDY7221138.1 DUF3147 family protein [Halalkalibacterium halodurans]MDY7240377.1 DUF3147 family protein [Halalkalibacterium halodurans]